MSVIATVLAATAEGAEHAAEGAEHAAEGAEHAAGAAGEHEEHASEVPFFVAGLLLAVWAIAVSVFGFMRPQFPETDGAARGVMGISAVLVASAMFTAVYVAL